MDTMHEVDDCLNNPRAEPLRMRTERDQLNNLIEQRTKYLKVPSEKMEEVRYFEKFCKISLNLGHISPRKANFSKCWARFRYYQSRTEFAFDRRRYYVNIVSFKTSSYRILATP